jgi:hypothetical protein
LSQLNPVNTMKLTNCPYTQEITRVSMNRKSSPLSPTQKHLNLVWICSYNLRSYRKLSVQSDGASACSQQSTAVMPLSVTSSYIRNILLRWIIFKDTRDCHRSNRIKDAFGLYSQGACFESPTGHRIFRLNIFEIS